MAVILAADIVGFSTLMERDEEGTYARVQGIFARIVEPTLTENSGRLVKTTGDGFLAEFNRPLEAVQVALRIQKMLSHEELAGGNVSPIQLRIGISLGDIIVNEQGDIFGDGVNIAARLEQISSPGGICITSAVYDVIAGKLDITFVDYGKLQLKNITRSVHVYGTSSGTSWRLKSGLSLPDKPSLAVLPFDNLSGIAAQDYVADGIVDAITATLSRIRSFFVIARNSALTFKGRTADVREIGSELGVAYLLRGSVQNAGSRLRIILQLVETHGGANVWSGRYDGSLEEIFELQDRMTEEVAGALQPSIRLAEIQRVQRKAPQDLGAYDYAMQAMPHVWAYEKDESLKALELLERALSLDPNYPLALSMAGWCHAHRSVYDWAEDVVQSRTLARALAERAAELSAEDPLILAVLGAVHTFCSNYGTARVLLERAVALDQNAAWAWSRLGWLDNYSDRPDQAFEKFERSMRLSPLDPMNFNNYVGMASAHEVKCEYDQAASLYKRGLAERPNAMWIYRNLASSLAGAGRMEEAARAFKQVLLTYPNLTASKVRQVMVFSPSFIDRMNANLKLLGLPDS